jgi:hypothetical protein
MKVLNSTVSGVGASLKQAKECRFGAVPLQGSAGRLWCGESRARATCNASEQPRVVAKSLSLELRSRGRHKHMFSS